MDLRCRNLRSMGISRLSVVSVGRKRQSTIYVVVMK